MRLCFMLWLLVALAACSRAKPDNLPPMPSAWVDPNSLVVEFTAFEIAERKRPILLHSIAPDAMAVIGKFQKLGFVFENLPALDGVPRVKGEHAVGGNIVHLQGREQVLEYAAVLFVIAEETKATTLVANAAIATVFAETGWPEGYEWALPRLGKGAKKKHGRNSYEAACTDAGDSWACIITVMPIVGAVSTSPAQRFAAARTALASLTPRSEDELRALLGPPNVVAHAADGKMLGWTYQTAGGEKRISAGIENTGKVTDVNVVE